MLFMNPCLIIFVKKCEFMFIMFGFNNSNSPEHKRHSFDIESFEIKSVFKKKYIYVLKRELMNFMN